MPSITSLIKRLREDYPAITLEEKSYFRWSHRRNLISYNPSHPDATAHLLHEYGHASLGHSDYMRDIELIRMEQEAWKYATSKLSEQYHTPLDQETIEDAMDTYREWLHERSSCPSCGATGVQKDVRLYRCLACGQGWNVNEARLCGLRRRLVP